MEKCDLYERCRKAFESLLIPIENRDPQFDKCYCGGCYKDNPVYSRGGKIYQMPIGACRFSFKPKIFSGDSHNTVFYKWHNSYHGIREKESIKSILEEGYQIPGTILRDGRRIAIPEGHIADHPKDDRKQIYTSPSFRYACVYARLHKFNGKKYRFIFQNRQKPDTYKTENETIPIENNIGEKEIDPDEMEYVSKEGKYIAIIGLLVCEENQEEIPENIDRFASIKVFRSIIEGKPIEKKEEKNEGAWKKTFLWRWCSLKEDFYKLLTWYQGEPISALELEEKISNCIDSVKKNKEKFTLEKLKISLLSPIRMILSALSHFKKIVIPYSDLIFIFLNIIFWWLSRNKDLIFMQGIIKEYKKLHDAEVRKMYTRVDASINIGGELGKSVTCAGNIIKISEYDELSENIQALTESKTKYEKEVEIGKTLVANLKREGESKILEGKRMVDDSFWQRINPWSEGHFLMDKGNEIIQEIPNSKVTIMIEERKKNISELGEKIISVEGKMSHVSETIDLVSIVGEILSVLTYAFEVYKFLKKDPEIELEKFKAKYDKFYKNNSLNQRKEK